MGPWEKPQPTKRGCSCSMTPGTAEYSIYPFITSPDRCRVPALRLPSARWGSDATVTHIGDLQPIQSRWDAPGPDCSGLSLLPVRCGDHGSCQLVSTLKALDAPTGYWPDKNTQHWRTNSSLLLRVPRIHKGSRNTSPGKSPPPAPTTTPESKKVSEAELWLNYMQELLLPNRMTGQLGMHSRTPWLHVSLRTMGKCLLYTHIMKGLLWAIFLKQRNCLLQKENWSHHF